MNEMQRMETIAGLFAGLQASIVEIIAALHFSGVANAEQIAQRLLNASANLPPTERNGALIALTMRQIATGLTAGNIDNTEEIRRLLH